MVGSTLNTEWKRSLGTLVMTMVLFRKRKLLLDLDAKGFKQIYEKRKTNFNRFVRYGVCVIEAMGTLYFHKYNIDNSYSSKLVVECSNKLSMT